MEEEEEQQQQHIIDRSRPQQDLVEDDAPAPPSPSNSSRAQPMFITVGPPCAGKTTWIRQHIRSSSSSSLTATDGGENETYSYERILDVSFDDQVGVYRAIPTGLFLEPSCTDGDSEEAGLSERVLGRTLYERLTSSDQEELRLVLQVLNATLPWDDFTQRLQQLYQKSEQHRSSAAAQSAMVEIFSPLCRAIQRSIAQCQEAQDPQRQAPPPDGHLPGCPLPPTIDLFIRESLFRSQKDYPPILRSSTEEEARNDLVPENHTTAMERAVQLLQSAPKDWAVAWGNTNTRPSEYKVALEVAAAQGRPVQFVVYDALTDKAQMMMMPAQPPNSLISAPDSTTPPQSSMDGASPSKEPSDGKDAMGWLQPRKKKKKLPASEYVEKSAFQLPALGLEGLYFRSIQRLLKTGRYVPASVMWDMHRRTTESLERVVDTWRRDVHSSASDSFSEDHTASTDLDSPPHPLMSAFDFNRWMVRMLEFDMDADTGMVTESYRPPPKRVRSDRNNNIVEQNQGRHYNYPGRGYNASNGRGDRPYRRDHDGNSVRDSGGRRRESYDRAAGNDSRSYQGNRLRDSGESRYDRSQASDRPTLDGRRQDSRQDGGRGDRYPPSYGQGRGQGGRYRSADYRDPSGRQDAGFTGRGAQYSDHRYGSATNTSSTHFPGRHRSSPPYGRGPGGRRDAPPY